MHIFGYVTDGFQSLNHSVVLNSLVFLGVLVVYVLAGSVPNRLRHMLADSVLQTLRRSTHVPTIARGSNVSTFAGDVGRMPKISYADETWFYLLNTFNYYDNCY